MVTAARIRISSSSVNNSRSVRDSRITSRRFSSSRSCSRRSRTAVTATSSRLPVRSCVPCYERHCGALIQQRCSGAYLISGYVQFIGYLREKYAFSIHDLRFIPVVYVRVFPAFFRASAGLYNRIVIKYNFKLFRLDRPADFRKGSHLHCAAHGKIAEGPYVDIGMVFDQLLNKAYFGPDDHTHSSLRPHPLSQRHTSPYQTSESTSSASATTSGGASGCMSNTAPGCSAFTRSTSLTDRNCGRSSSHPTA